MKTPKQSLPEATLFRAGEVSSVAQVASSWLKFLEASKFSHGLSPGLKISFKRVLSVWSPQHLPPLLHQSIHKLGRTAGFNYIQAKNTEKVPSGNHVQQKLAEIEKCLNHVSTNIVRTLLGTKGIATGSKDATRGSWPYY